MSLNVLYLPNGEKNPEDEFEFDGLYPSVNTVMICLPVLSIYLLENAEGGAISG